MESYVITMNVEEFIDRYFYKEWVQDLLERANLPYRGIKQELILRLRQEGNCDLFQLMDYLDKDDLKEICDDLEIPRSGRKYEIVRRILNKLSESWAEELFVAEMNRAMRNHNWSAEDLEERLGYLYDRYEEASQPISQPITGRTNQATRKQIFIVHGRDKTPALQLARIVEKRYPLDAVILEEEPHRGRTLIEKLEDYSNVNYVFITLTPDDIGALRGEPLKERARQNVIFELGQFIGKIGRGNVCLLIKGGIEIPSDLSGVGYYRFHNSVRELFLEIERELITANII